MKKIVHLSHTDINSDGRILKEINALAKGGYHVNGVGVIMNEGTEESSLLDENVTVESIRVHSRNFKWLPKTVMHSLSVVEITLKMLFGVIKAKPEVIHCHDTIVLPLGVVAKFFTRSKLIYDAHELESDRNGLSKTQGRLTLFFEKSLWKYIDRLIVVSPSIAQWYLKNVGHKPVTIILNAPSMNSSTTEKKLSRNYLREVFSIPDHKKIFVYVGILAEGRGIEQILSIFKGDSINACVVFLGYGGLKKEIEEVSANYKNVYVHKPVEHEKVTSIIESADAGLCLIQNVSLSDYFCLPNKLFEYSLAGLPVLASDFPDIRNCVSKYNLGICCDLTEESIRDGVVKLSQDVYDYKVKCIELEDLSWESQEIKLLDMYKTLGNQ